MLLASPGRPVVRGEHHIGTVGEGVDRLGQVARPGMRVAYQGAPQRQQVVQVMGGVLGHAQGAEAWEIEVHFGRGLGARRHLKFDLHAVDGVRLTGRLDVDGRDDEGYLAGGRGLAQPATHLILGSARQQRAVHIGRATRHCRTGVDVLLHGVLGETLRRQHRHRAGIDVRL